jgi:hypothetical protein
MSTYPSAFRMETKPAAREEPSWQALQQHFDSNKDKLNIKELLKSDPKRFNKFR